VFVCKSDAKHGKSRMNRKNRGRGRGMCPPAHPAVKPGPVRTADTSTFTQSPAAVLPQPRCSMGAMVSKLPPSQLVLQAVRGVSAALACACVPLLQALPTPTRGSLHDLLSGTIISKQRGLEVAQDWKLVDTSACRGQSALLAWLMGYTGDTAIDQPRGGGCESAAMCHEPCTQSRTGTQSCKQASSHLQSIASALLECCHGSTGGCSTRSQL